MHINLYPRRGLSKATIIDGLRISSDFRLCICIREAGSHLLYTNMTYNNSTNPPNFVHALQP